METVARQASKTTTRVSDDDARRTGPALEAMYQLTRWLIPTLDRFPRRQKFLLGGRIQNTALAAPAQDIRGADGRAHDLPRLRPALRRPASAAGGERTPFPQSAPRHARSRACGCHDIRRGAAARGELGGARAACEYPPSAARTVSRRALRSRCKSSFGSSGGSAGLVREPDRPMNAGCCVAARGTTIRGTCVPRIATGTPPETGTTTSVSELPVRPAAGILALTGAGSVLEAVQGRP